MTTSCHSKKSIFSVFSLTFDFMSPPVTIGFLETFFSHIFIPINPSNCLLKVAAQYSQKYLLSNFWMILRQIFTTFSWDSSDFNFSNDLHLSKNLLILWGLEKPGVQLPFYSVDYNRPITSTQNAKWTLPASYLPETCITIKINWNLYFHTCLWRFKRFYEDL